MRLRNDADFVERLRSDSLSEIREFFASPIETTLEKLSFHLALLNETASAEPMKMHEIDHGGAESIHGLMQRSELAHQTMLLCAMAEEIDAAYDRGSSARGIKK